MPLLDVQLVHVHRHSQRHLILIHPGPPWQWLRYDWDAGAGAEWIFCCIMAYCGPYYGLIIIVAAGSSFDWRRLHCFLLVLADCVWIDRVNVWHAWEFEAALLLAVATLVGSLWLSKLLAATCCKLFCILGVVVGSNKARLDWAPGIKTLWLGCYTASLTTMSITSILQQELTLGNFIDFFKLNCTFSSPMARGNLSFFTSITVLVVARNGCPRMMEVCKSSSISITTKSTGTKNLAT